MTSEHMFYDRRVVWRLCIGTLGAAWLGCGGATSPASDAGTLLPTEESEIALEAVSTVPEPLPERPARAARSPEPTPLATLEPIELPRACLDYLTAMKACFQASAPGAQDILGPVMESVADQWREMIREDPRARAALAETCTAISSSLSNSATCLPSGLGPLPLGPPLPNP